MRKRSLSRLGVYVYTESDIIPIASRRCLGAPNFCWPPTFAHAVWHKTTKYRSN